jgi:hypothetical protein
MLPSDQSISGFIGIPLPGAVGISKIGPHPKLFLQTGMQLMFTAIIQRGGLASQLRGSTEEPELYLSVNPSSVSIPNNRISFPMTPPDYQSLLVGVGSKPGGGF